MRQAHEFTRDTYDREHATSWVADRTGEDRVVTPRVAVAVARADLRVTVGTRDDLAYRQRVPSAAQAGRRLVALHDIIDAADRLASSGHSR